MPRNKQHWRKSLLVKKKIQLATFFARRRMCPFVFGPGLPGPIADLPAPRGEWSRFPNHFPDRAVCVERDPSRAVDDTSFYTPLDGGVNTRPSTALLRSAGTPASLGSMLNSLSSEMTHTFFFFSFLFSFHRVQFGKNLP